MIKTITYIYLLLITYLLLKPTENTTIMFWGFDKLVHIIFFAILTILIKIAFKTKYTYSVWIILIISYAIVIEILQHLMKLGRSFSLFDIIADVIGIYLVIKLTTSSKHR